MQHIPSDRRAARSCGRGVAIALILSIGLLTGCVSSAIDKYHVLLRSDIIRSEAQEQEILSKARTEWTSDGRIRVLFVRGTPYERGYQHGALLRGQVRDNLLSLYSRALQKYPLEEMFAEAYERMRPFISQEYADEMRGLAHGAKLPLSVIHAIHALPEIGEWGGTKEIRNTVLKMLHGEIGESCSNFTAIDATGTGEDFYAIRILDWGLHRISRLHEYPLILVAQPDEGLAYANIGWMGFLGAISGMNEAGITLGEMGYGNPPGETLSGKPMPFLLRDILSDARSLADVRRIIQESPGTNSFAYLMSDGKTHESELYIRDPSRFLRFKAGESITDGKNNFPGHPGVTYGGHYQDRLIAMMNDHHRRMTPELIMKDLIPAVAMRSNFQNVIYDPARLRFWVNNAKSATEPAFGQPYTSFDLGAALARFRTQEGR